MDMKDFEAETELLLRKCMHILRLGQNDYAGKDVLENFNMGANMLGCESKEYLGALLYKHLSSILKYCRGKTLLKEGIEDRIVDAINYLLLLNALSIEERQRRESETT